MSLTQAKGVTTRPVSAPWALWIACGIGFLVLSALWPVHARSSGEMGWDFTPFYVATHLPFQDLYDHAAYIDLSHRLLDDHGIRYFPPYIRPAAFVLPLKPLGWVSYWRAFLIWSGIQFLSYLAVLCLLWRIRPYRPEMLLGWALFYPPMHGIWEGRDDAVILLLVVCAFVSLKRGWDRLGGILFSLCMYKFNLFLLLPFYLIVKRRWKAFWYGVGGVAVLVGLSFSLRSPLAYAEYLRRIPEMTIRFDPGSMPVLRGLTLEHPWLYGLLAAVVAVLTVWGIRRTDETFGFAIALTGSLLIAYYAFYYDLTLLAFPIVIALSRGGLILRVPSLVLLVGVPLWFAAPRYMAVAAAMLFAGLLASAPRRSDRGRLA